jgi:hypothetical protein
MALPDAKPFQVIQKVDAGASFEVWRSTAGALRLDWNRQGVVLETMLGYGSHEFGTVIARRWEALRRGGVQVLILIDFWDMPNYDSGFRTTMQDWALKNRTSMVQTVHILTSSKLVSMGVAVANLALGGIITAHTQRPPFDAAVKKLGLAARPQMPSLSAT